jgi:hypothetical protein
MYTAAQACAEVCGSCASSVSATAYYGGEATAHVERPPGEQAWPQFPLCRIGVAVPTV